MRRKLLIFNYRIPVFPKNTDHDHMYFLVKYKIPRLHSGMINAARFLSQSQGFNLQLFAQNSVYQVAVGAALLKPFALKGRFVIIWTSDWLMINYFNFLVKYHSISKSIATLKRRIEKRGFNDEIRDTDRNLLDEPVCNWGWHTLRKDTEF